MFQFGPNCSAVVSSYPGREFRLLGDLRTALIQTSNFSCAEPNARIQERMIKGSESPSHDPLPMKIIFNLFLVRFHTVWLF